MFIEFKDLAKNSRVWIYQSDRAFTKNEIALISLKAEDFINSWTRHGDDLKGSFTIKYNQFLVIIYQLYNIASFIIIICLARIYTKVARILDV